MAILLLAVAWIMVMEVFAFRFLLQALRTGILETTGRRGFSNYRTEKQRSPSRYWFGISLIGGIMIFMSYFGCLMTAEVVRFAILES